MATAQTGHTARTDSCGIKFEQLSFQEVLAKAKLEKRFIFIDCYATWCKPCKRMDTLVYTNDSVGRFLNSQFLSVKVQMDSTRLDSDKIKDWYADAKSFKKQYNINALPTFLFFSPEGQILHKDVGFKNVNDFISLAKESLNPNQQYYSLFKKVQENKKDYFLIGNVARKAMKIGEKSTAEKLAGTYINNYLLRLNDAALYTKSNIEFLISFRHLLNTRRSRFFNIFYMNGRVVDSIMEDKGSAQRIVDHIITNEEIAPFIKTSKTKDPDWETAYNRIKKKYSLEYATRTIIDSKIEWYHNKGDWAKYTKYSVEKVKKVGVDTSDWFGDYSLNRIAYEVFLYSNNREEISTALEWMKDVLKRDTNPARLDTYASLLYKLGRVPEAISVQEQAIRLDPNNKDIRDGLDKMKRGEVTWVK